MKPQFAIEHIDIGTFSIFNGNENVDVKYWYNPSNRMFEAYYNNRYFSGDTAFKLMGTIQANDADEKIFNQIKWIKVISLDYSDDYEDNRTIRTELNEAWLAVIPRTLYLATWHKNDKAPYWLGALYCDPADENVSLDDIHNIERLNSPDIQFPYDHLNILFLGWDQALFDKIAKWRSRAYDMATARPHEIIKEVSGE